MIFINVSEIKVPRRPFKPDEGYRELVADIQKNGILIPLLVKKVGKTYEIIDGLRRYNATILARRLQVPVEVV